MLSGKEKRLMRAQANQIMASVRIGREGMSSIRPDHFVVQTFKGG